MTRRQAPPKSQRAPRAPSRRRAGSDTESGFTHHPAGQGAAQPGPVCCRDSSQEKKSLVLVTTSGGLALALVSLHGYLSTCISITQEITRKRSGLFTILCLIFVAALTGACCGTLLTLWMLREKEMPQVKALEGAEELPDRRCFPGVCRNSLALLGQEVQQLRNEVTSMAAEMSHVKKELLDTRMAISAMPLEENVLMSAWALKSAGFTINLQRLPRSYAWPFRVLRFFVGLNPLDTFVQPDISPGYCWPVQASRSQVVIRLPAQVRPATITVQHPLKTSVLMDISSAPRDFTVFGVGEEEEDTLLGTFSYDIENKPTQTFILQNELHRAFQFIRLLIQSNWGKSGSTCIYRVQVHGRIVE
ncbi:unnamed protein product [Bubo scandiacus]